MNMPAALRAFDAAPGRTRAAAARRRGGPSGGVGRGRQRTVRWEGTWISVLPSQR